MSEAMNAARKVIEDFENIFGDLTTTEGDWLARKIAEAIQARPARAHGRIASFYQIGGLDQ